MRLVLLPCAIVLLVLMAQDSACMAEPVQIDYPSAHAFLADSELWVGTVRDGVIAVDLSTFRTRHLVQGGDLPSNRTLCGIRAFSRIWLGTFDGLFASQGNNAWERMGDGALPSKEINCLESVGGLLWVGTARGLASYDPEAGNWTAHSDLPGLSGSIFALDGVGSDLWIGTIRGGVLLHDTHTGAWRSWGREDGLPTNTVFCVSASRDIVFAGTMGGLSVLNRSTDLWSSYGSEKLPSPSVYAVKWLDALDQAWLGTGYGISIFDASDETFESTTNVGEIELERINDIVTAAGALWLIRVTNLWYNHQTTAMLGYDPVEKSWIRPIKVDVLVDQVGYAPGHPKAFKVQSNEPIEGEGSFELLNRGGEVVLSGELGERIDRVDWDTYYWNGDFTEFRKRGNFTLRVRLGEHVSESFVFEIDNNVILEGCGELVYEFLRYMRCGVAHEHRDGACHLDDGVLPNGTHIDATGGWHCAGLWGGKYSEYHTYVIFNLLYAHDLRPEFYGSIDRDGNGQPDILDEAMWGCEFLLKMQMANGSILHEVVKVEETDGVIGTPDDRAIRGWMPVYNGILAVANLAGTAALVGENFPAEASRYLQGALLGLEFYGLDPQEGPSHSLNGAAMVLALAQLHRATGNLTYLSLAETLLQRTLQLPLHGYYGTFEVTALHHYLLLNPSTESVGPIAEWVRIPVDRRLVTDSRSTNPHHPFTIPTWRLYIMDPYGAAALVCYDLTGNASYLVYGLGCLDCHLGVNPYGMCMLEGVGSYNSPGYASYFRRPGNMRAAAPGSIPQGIRFVRDRPYYDISINPSGKSAETWLINTDLLQIVCLLPLDDDEYPLEVPESLGAILLCLAPLLWRMLRRA